MIYSHLIRCIGRRIKAAHSAWRLFVCLSLDELSVLNTGICNPDDLRDPSLARGFFGSLEFLPVGLHKYLSKVSIGFIHSTPYLDEMDLPPT